MFEEVEDPRSDAERAYHLLRRDILSGDRSPLERLRPADLQKRFEVGLTPIREALTRLAVEGLVQTESQRGFRVRPVTLDELADLMSTRRDLERRCLELAIRHGDAVWEAAIVSAMHLLSRTPLPDTVEDRAAADLWETRHRAFHLALVAGCGSEWRLRFWAQLSDQSERYRKLRLLHHRDEAARVGDANAEHRAIMEAVLARDAPRAGRLMDAHLSATEQAIASLLALAAGA